MLSISPSSIERLRHTLLSEGFRNAGIWQMWKKGQVFGYVRLLRNDLEWHIRAFPDGTLESEIEPPRTTIKHLLITPIKHDGILAQFLNRHRIPFSAKWSRQPLRKLKFPSR